MVEMNRIPDVPSFNRPVEIPIPDIPVPAAQVIRRLGYPAGHEIEPGIRRMIDTEIEASESLFRFRGIAVLLQIQTRDDRTLTFRNSSFTIQSSQVSAMLRGSDRAALFMVTIGPALEGRVKELLDSEEPTRAFILDAAGSETSDAAADYVHRTVLSEIASRDGRTVTPRFSPGYGDWDLCVQPDLLRACRGDRIGISVTRSCLMLPRKSVSAVLGLAP